jgi:hypothetical protein
MDLRGDECRKLLGEESFKLLGHWLDSCDREALLNAVELAEEREYAVQDEEGAIIGVFEATTETAATVAMLLTRAVNVQREKVAKWMIEHGFATGHGDTQEDLLEALTWQIAELRLKTAKSKEEVLAALKGLPREELARMGIV